MALRPGRDALVGREREIGVLLAALDDMERRRGRLILLGGDPGIGKTRLADELAARARDRGHLVLWGRGWQDAGAPPYWPWVQILRGYLRLTSGPALARRLGRHAAPLGQILPELSEVADETAELTARVPRQALPDPDSARYRLFDAVTAVLLAAAADRPLVVVVDDLHAADAASILLLEFLAGQLADARILVVATYRDTELSPGHPLIEGLAELARHPTTRVLPIAGISAAAIAELLAEGTGTRPRPTVVRLLQRTTGGNPLFLGEAVRLFGPDPAPEELAEASLAAAIPREIREVISRRIVPLGPETVEVLRLAAALGPEFELEPLCRIAGLDRHEVVRRLAGAIDAGLVVDVAGSGRFRFGHDLVRETLYGEIPTDAAARLHLRIATTLEALSDGSPDQHLPELAYHFARALPQGDADKAIDYAARAGRSAARALAYEEAARLFRLALRALELDAKDDPRLRCGLLLELGDAEARAGDLASAQEAFLRAADLARSIGSGPDLAEAALGYGGRFIWSRAGADPHLVPLLQDALALLADDVRLRIRVMARLACAWRSSPERYPDGDALTRQALDLARGLDDPETLSYALAGRFWATYWPENPHDRLAIAQEILEVARQTRDGERLLDGHQTQCIVDLDLGWIGAARSEIEAARRVALELRQPTQVFAMRTYEVVLGLLAGSYPEVEAMLTAESAVSEINSTGDARSSDTMHLFLLRREQGRTGEVEGAVRALARDAPWYPYFRSVLACVLIDEGRLDEARAVFDDLARDDFRALPRDSQWLSGICLASEAGARLHDASAAGVLYDQLRPFAGRHAIAHAEGSLGTVDRYLGLLAATLGRLDDADRHFLAAIELDGRLGSDPWLGHDLVDRAEVLAQRGRADDVPIVGRLQDDARAIVERFGLVALSRRLEPSVPAGGEPLAPVSRPGDAAIGPAELGVFRHEGEYWTIAFGGTECRLRDSKGLAYLARLLAEPAREIAALDLAAGLAARADGTHLPRRELEGSLRIASFGDGDEVLDEAARRAYRERIIELDTEIGEAEAWNDPERLARLRAERSVLVQQLAAAFGIGGRARITGSPAERARLSVAKAIRSSMTRIQAACPPLGRHLTVAIRTGSFCAYVPDPALALTWTF